VLPARVHHEVRADAKTELDLTASQSLENLSQVVSCHALAKKWNEALTAPNKLLKLRPSRCWDEPKVHGISPGIVQIGRRGHSLPERMPGQRSRRAEMPAVRIGIAGCGVAARIHLERLLGCADVDVVGCADRELAAALDFASIAAANRQNDSQTIRAFDDHRELLRQTSPDVLAIFTPHLHHYRVAMDALQAGCHLFIEKPLSTNVQEAADIVTLARARGRVVGVGHQYRLAPSLIEARRRLADGVLGPIRLVTAILARPWLVTLGAAESHWRFDPKVAGGGILADSGDHLVDAVLWTTQQAPQEVAAVQSQWDPGIDLVTGAVIRLADGTPVTMAISGISPGSVFAIDYYGELGRLHATDTSLEEERFGAPPRQIELSPQTQSVDSNFIASLQGGSPLCCPADHALDTVRLLEAIARSATTRQVVRLV
jgi:predicted dehydrogenase